LLRKIRGNGGLKFRTISIYRLGGAGKEKGGRDNKNGEGLIKAYSLRGGVRGRDGKSRFWKYRKIQKGAKSG